MPQKWIAPQSVNDLIVRIYNDKRVKEFISKMKPEYLQDDLMMHCVSEMYRVAELYPGKLESLDNKKNELFAWFIGMAKMQLFSKRSTFYRKHRRCFEDDTTVDINNHFEQTEYEFPVEDIERDRMIEWAYEQIELNQLKKDKRWFKSTLMEATPVLF